MNGARNFVAELFWCIFYVPWVAVAMALLAAGFMVYRKVRWARRISAWAFVVGFSPAATAFSAMMLTETVDERAGGAVVLLCLLCVLPCLMAIGVYVASPSWGKDAPED
jgi:hypothetical protein